MKLEIRIDDDETRALWETAKKAKAEVESWPAWKHNEVPSASSDAAWTLFHRFRHAFPQSNRRDVSRRRQLVARAAPIAERTSCIQLEKP